MRLELGGRSWPTGFWVQNLVATKAARQERNWKVIESSKFYDSKHFYFIEHMSTFYFYKLPPLTGHSFARCIKFYVRRSGKRMAQLMGVAIYGSLGPPPSSWGWWDARALAWLSWWGCFLGGRSWSNVYFWQFSNLQATVFTNPMLPLGLAKFRLTVVVSCDTSS